MQNFQCYQLALSAVRLVRPLIDGIEVHDRVFAEGKWRTVGGRRRG